jgi:hypothetical protein
MMELLSFCQVTIDSQAEWVHLRECGASCLPKSTVKKWMEPILTVARTSVRACVTSLERVAIARTGMWRELFTRARFPV